MLFTHFRYQRAADPQRVESSGRYEKHKYEAFDHLKPPQRGTAGDRICPGLCPASGEPRGAGRTGEALPSSMQSAGQPRWGIDPATRQTASPGGQKRELVQLMKHWRVSIDARGDLAHAAVIPSGGVSVREVDP